METIKCPICMIDNAELLWMAKDYTYFIPGEFPLVRCRECGLVYLRTRPSPEEINNYYPNEYLPYRKPIQEEKNPLMRWARERNIKKRVQTIKSTMQNIKGNILDIGCSTGIFLNAIQKEGWIVKGIDINPSVAQFAHDYFGIDVFIGELSEAGYPSEFFDAITLWDTWEHTFNPVDTIKEIRNILKDNGLIYITLPNWESLDRRIFGKFWVGFDTPRHLFAFPTRVLERILFDAGFKIITKKCGLGGYYTFLASLNPWLFQKISNERLRKGILSILYFPGVRFLFQPIFTLLDLLGIGGTIILIIKKL